MKSLSISVEGDNHVRLTELIFKQIMQNPELRFSIERLTVLDNPAEPTVDISCRFRDSENESQP